MESQACTYVGGASNQQANLKNKVLLGGDGRRRNLCEDGDIRLSENKLNTSRRRKRKGQGFEKGKMERNCMCVYIYIYIVCVNNRLFISNGIRTHL